MSTATRKPLTARHQNVEMPPALRSGTNAEKVEKKVKFVGGSSSGKRGVGKKKGGGTSTKKASGTKKEAVDLDEETGSEHEEEMETKVFEKTAGVGAEMEDLAKLFGQTSITGGGTTMVRRPTRPQTGYQLFVMRQKAGEVDAKAVWKDMSAEEKKDFNEDAGVVADRERYAREMGEFNRVLEMIDEENRAVEFAQRKMLQEKAMKFYMEHLDKQSESKTGKEQKEEVEVPKKARSAYVLFVMENQGKDSKELGELWKKTKASRGKKSKETIATFEKKAAEDVKRYQEEMQAYEQAMNERKVEKEMQGRALREQAVTTYREEMRTQEDARKYRELMQKGGVKDEEDGETTTTTTTTKAKAKAKAKKVRAKTGYNMFVGEMSKKEDVKKRVAKEGTTMLKLVSKLWREVEEDERKVYEELAQIETKRIAGE